MSLHITVFQTPNPQRAAWPRGRVVYPLGSTPRGKWAQVRILLGPVLHGRWPHRGTSIRGLRLPGEIPGGTSDFGRMYLFTSGWVGDVLGVGPWTLPWTLGPNLGPDLGPDPLSSSTG